MARMLTLAALLFFTPILRAQDHPDPPARPGPKPIAPKTVAPPKEDSIPGLEDADFRIAPAPLRREGSFVTRQRGSLVRLPSGDRAFVFHKDAQGRAERPMVLLPCLALQGMEQIIADRKEDTAFLITGQIYAYRGVNYLLPSAAPTAPGPEPEAPKPDASKPDAPKPEGGPAPQPADPAVQDLIRDLEAQRDRPRTLGSSPAAAPPQPAATPTDLMAEGTTISLRRGRIVRLSGGEWAFAMDNTPASDAATDKALIINPCLNLQRLESWAAQLGDGSTVLMSGRIYQYRGRNHIIPTMYQVVTGLAGELTPR